MFISKLVLALVYLWCVSADPVSLVSKCPPSDSKCLKSVTQAAIPKFAAGLPQYGIEPVDPVVLDKIDASSPNLKLILTNVKVDGIKNCIAKKVERNLEKSKLSVTIQCTIDLNGNYEMNGKLLFIPIEGKDKLHVKLTNAIFKAEADLADITKDGVKYMNIKQWDHAYKLQEKSVVQFDNLFNGNQALAEAAQQVIRDNGNEIIDEVGQPVIKAVVAKIVDTIQKFFHAVPKNQLADD